LNAISVLQAIQQLRGLLVQMCERLHQDDHDHLPELVRQYLDQVHAACADADSCPAPEPLRQLLAEQQQVMAQMRQQQQALAQAIASRHHGERAARAYRCASA